MFSSSGSGKKPPPQVCSAVSIASRSRVVSNADRRRWSKSVRTNPSHTTRGLRCETRDAEDGIDLVCAANPPCPPVYRSIRVSLRPHWARTSSVRERRTTTGKRRDKADKRSLWWTARRRPSGGRLSESQPPRKTRVSWSAPHIRMPTCSSSTRC